MFILDSLMISGIRWALETALTAAEAEMNDDSVLREQLIETELRREMGEISDEEFQAIEADLLARIREIRDRRGATGPLEMGAHPMETTGDSRFTVEASVSGDFYDPAAAPHTTVVESAPKSGEEITVLDMTGPKGAKGAKSANGSRTSSRGTSRTSRTSRISK